MTFTGLCQNGDCGEKVDKGFFCCPECKDDYERIEQVELIERALEFYCDQHSEDDLEIPQKLQFLTQE